MTTNPLHNDPDAGQRFLGRNPASPPVGVEAMEVRAVNAGGAETLDDLEHDAKYLPTATHPDLIRLIQDLHAGISRRDWQATELAANKLRDVLK